MAAAEGLTAAIDQVVALFNARKMDLPDGFFDRKTQFIINGAPFETLLGQSPSDPLILMLSRGPAGFRFAAKALQHALPDAKLDRGEITSDGHPLKMTTQLRLSGTLRGTAETVNAAVVVTLHLAATGPVQIAAAEIDPPTLDRIRAARLRA